MKKWSTYRTEKGLSVLCAVMEQRKQPETQHIYYTQFNEAAGGGGFIMYSWSRCGLASLRAGSPYRGAVSWCSHLGGNCSWYFLHTLSTSVLGPGKAFPFLWAWEHQHPWHCHVCTNNTPHKGWGLETMYCIYDGMLSSLILCREPQPCGVHMSCHT